MREKRVREDMEEERIAEREELHLPLSVGEARVREDMEEDRLAEATESIEGKVAPGKCSGLSLESAGRQVSTIASRQFTNSSAFVWVPLAWTINN